MRKTILVLWINLAFLVLSAQNYHFDQLNVDHGLSQNTVNCILKDKRGYIWIGTNDGLNRYDGYQFTIYRNKANESNSLSNNKIYAILEDDLGRIWVGTKNGLNLFDYSKDCFHRYYDKKDEATTLSDNFIRALYQDRAGRIWIGTYGGGLQLWSEEDQCFIKTPLAGIDKQTKGQKLVSSIYEDQSGQLWVASGAYGLFKLDYDLGESSFIPFSNERDNRPPVQGKFLYEDRFNQLWVATQGDGLYRLSKDRKTIDHLNSNTHPVFYNNVVKDLVEDEEGNLWIATDGGGIVFYSPEKNEFSRLQNDRSRTHSLASNAVYTLYKDDQEIIWVGTFDGGISIFNKNQNKFHTYSVQTQRGNGLSHRSVLCFLESKDGELWIGTDGGGLNKLDVQSGRFDYLNKGSKGKYALSSNVITALHEDRKGQMWIGTYMGGLQCYREGEGIVARFQQNPNVSTSIRNNNVWSILEDRKGRLWLGTLGGLDIIDQEKGTFNHINTIDLEKPNNYEERVTVLFEDQQGRLWVGGKGIRYFDEETGSLGKLGESIDQFLDTYDVRAFGEDRKGRFWVGTEGGGLFLIDLEDLSLKNFTSLDGLPSNVIHTILEDDDGFIWLSTNNGLSRFHPDRLLSQSEDDLMQIFKNYDKEDGLQSNQFSYNAGIKSREGVLYFGGINGFNRFHPKDIKDNPFIPAVDITALKIYDQYVKVGENNSPLTQQINTLQEIELSYEQSLVFSLEFTALNFTSSGKNQYAYHLEGFMDDWSYIGQQRAVTFTNLDAGDYVFRVKASNNDGLWNEQGTALKITILPPFWKSNWAYVLYIVLFLLLLLAFRYTLLVRERMKNDLKIKDLEKRKVEEVNQLKLAFFTNISHEFLTPLTLITGPIEQMLAFKHFPKEAQQQLKIVQRNTKRLMRLIKQLLEFQKVEEKKLDVQLKENDIVQFTRSIKEAFNNLAERKKIHYDFSTNESKFLVSFDPDILEKILYNLVSNAFKFTHNLGAIHINLHIDQEKNCYQILVEDNGIGISPERQTYIFNRFYQIASNPIQKNKPTQPGSGIGLAYTKELVELHGGQINLDSELHKGSRFTVCLPINFENKSEKIEIESSNYKFVKSIGYEEISLDAMVNGLELGNDALVEKPILLIIEDNIDVRKFIQCSFHKEFQILEAANGEEGVALAIEHVPDIIISDIMMPKKDGIVVCQELKKDNRTSHIPIILLTADTNQERWVQGLTTGADDYITKPFNFKILYARVHNLILSRRLLKKRFSQDILKPQLKEIASPDELFLKNAIDIIETNMADSEFGVNQFAQKLGMSRSVLYRKFSAITEQSVKEFINTIRLKQAAQLLLSQPHLTISEIAYKVGFNDAQYFSKKFKKVYKCNPSQYLEKQEKEAPS